MLITKTFANNVTSRLKKSICYKKVTKYLELNKIVLNFAPRKVHLIVSTLMLHIEFAHARQSSCEHNSALAESRTSYCTIKGTD